MRCVQWCGNLNILWHCLSLGLEWKLTFSSPVATAEFSKFVGVLNAALSQHYLSGFEIAQLEFHHLHYLCSYWCFLRPTWLRIPGCLALGEWSHHRVYLRGHPPERSPKIMLKGSCWIAACRSLVTLTGVVLGVGGKKRSGRVGSWCPHPRNQGRWVVNACRQAWVVAAAFLEEGCHEFSCWPLQFYRGNLFCFVTF